MAFPIDHRYVAAGNAFANYYGRSREGVHVVSRRGLLKAGLAGVAGLSLPELLSMRAEAAKRAGR